MRARFMLAGMFNYFPRNSRTVFTACLASALYFLSSAPILSAADTDEGRVARQNFQVAVKELRTGAGPRYEALRQDLEDYPLAIYLDAMVIEANLHYEPAISVLNFMRRANDSPLALRTLRSFVRHKVADRRWDIVIAVTEDQALTTELMCHRAHALLMKRDMPRALPLLKQVWIVGESQIKSCDPAFKAWFSATGPSDEIVWARALKAADARNSSLLRYLQRFSSEELKKSLEDLAVVFRRPNRVMQKTRGSESRQRDIAYIGVKRLARVNPGKAFDALGILKRRFTFSSAQEVEMQSLIVRHSLFAKSTAPRDWVAEQLSTLGQDDLVEIYLRTTIETSDWVAFREAYEWLSSSKQSSDEWRYWRAIAGAPGEAERSQETLNALATGRGFHAYLAADILGLPLTLGLPMTLGMTDRDGDGDTDESSVEIPSVLGKKVAARVVELQTLGREWEARTEFRGALWDPDAATILAEVAAGQGWHSWAIEAAAAAGAWDRVDLRFPMVFGDAFENAAEESGLPIEELLSVARRESALSKDAVSTVGARGLMQVMPSTARLTARKHNYRYSKSRLMRPEYNAAIGALYYADLIDSYDGNRVLALAAYNAGPNRVRRWREGDASVARWVDTIPFKETREYVRAVLAYNVIYRLLAGKEAELLRANERGHQY